MTPKRDINGFTMVEILITAALATLFLVLMAVLFKSLNTYFRHTRVSQELNRQGRGCIDTIGRFLRQGLATSVVTCTCADPSVSCEPAGVPCTAAAANSSTTNSRIEFSTQDGSAYAFYWANGSVYMQVTPPARATRVQRLAENVGALQFTVVQSDLAIVDVSLTLKESYSGSQNSDKIDTLFLNQEIHMIATQ